MIEQAEVGGGCGSVCSESQPATGESPGHPTSSQVMGVAIWLSEQTSTHRGPRPGSPAPSAGKINLPRWVALRPRRAWSRGTHHIEFCDIRLLSVTFSQVNCRPTR